MSDWSGRRGDQWATHLEAMEATLRLIDQPIIRALHLEAPSRIAEVGCGGGGTALAVMQRAPAGSIVDGFDISPRLVELARARVQPAGPAASFAVADMATVVPARPYDRLVSRFGVMFFADPAAAFANLVRWLAPGGRFAFAVWGPPSDNPWMTSVRDVVAQIVDLPQADADAPGLFRYARHEVLLQLLAGAGFVELEVRDWYAALPIGGDLKAAAAAEFALSAFSSFEDLLVRAGTAAMAEARQSLSAAFSHYEHDGVVRLGARVLIVTGARDGC